MLFIRVLLYSFGCFLSFVYIYTSYESIECNKNRYQLTAKKKPTPEIRAGNIPVTKTG